jgi:putative acyl-CoA dehydrogenase
MTEPNDRIDPHATHAVFNQPPPLEGHNIFSSDRALAEALRREGADWAEERVRAFGEIAGRPETIAWGFQANEHRPVLRSHDRGGHRIDEVEFHPAWHALLGLGVAHGLHALPWREPRPGAHVARAALFATLAQVEAGVGCPLSMTYSVVPALRAEPEVAAEWEPRFTSFSYEPRLIPAGEKPGAICGMAMTEKQGGSDVRANATRAVPISGSEYEITGHKWFCSAPMSDAFLILAQAPGGLTCFLLPRFTPDGARNRIHLQRLKDKLGNRSNASSEIELRAEVFGVQNLGSGVARGLNDQSIPEGDLEPFLQSKRLQNVLTGIYDDFPAQIVLDNPGRFSGRQRPLRLSADVDVELL